MHAASGTAANLSPKYNLASLLTGSSVLSRMSGALSTLPATRTPQQSTIPVSATFRASESKREDSHVATNSPNSAVIAGQVSFNSTPKCCLKPLAQYNAG